MSENAKQGFIPLLCKKTSKYKEMNQLITDLWPYLMTGLITVVAWQFRESYAIKMRVVVLEQTIEDLMKTIESMQRRQDSHGRKQDEIVSLITNLKIEVVKQIGEMSSSVKVLASDVKNLNNHLVAAGDVHTKSSGNHKSE